MAKWLAEEEEEEEKSNLNILRRNISKGLPCGDEVFIKKLEKLAGITLKFRPQGRPKKKKRRR